MGHYTEKDFERLKWMPSIFLGEKSRMEYKPNNEYYWVCNGGNPLNDTIVFGPFQFRAAVKCYEHNKNKFKGGLVLVDCVKGGFRSPDVWMWGTGDQVNADLSWYTCKRCKKHFRPVLFSASFEFCYYCYPHRFEFTCKCGGVFDYGRYRIKCNKCERDDIRLSRRMASKNRRARKLEVGGSYTQEDVDRQYKRQRGKCYYCNTKVGKRYQVDHVYPLTRDYSWNGPENLVIACPPCNLKKGNKYPHEWPEGGRLL